MNLVGRGVQWKVQAFDDCPAFYTDKPPSWFHRLMQRWFFGFRWTRE